jgi:VanZ family protein
MDKKRKKNLEERPLTPRRRILAFMPAIVIMALIFFFSAQPAEESGEVSEFLGERLFLATSDLFGLGWTMQKIAALNLEAQHAIRKAAHFTEYFILGLALFSGFRVNFPKAPGRRYGIPGNWTLPAVITASLYAASDEIHQIFIPGRAFQVTDIAVDSAGALLGIGVFALLAVIVLSVKKKKSAEVKSR